MAQADDQAIAGAREGIERFGQLADSLASVATPEAVFGKPMQAGDYTVITVSEAVAGMGFGFGIGSGSAQGGDEQATRAGETGTSGQSAAGGSGGGGGGGGFATSRPVALIKVGPDGVTFEPIMDLTKLGLAALTTFGAMLMMRARMNR